VKARNKSEILDYFKNNVKSGDIVIHTNKQEVVFYEAEIE